MSSSATLCEDDGRWNRGSVLFFFHLPGFLAFLAKGRLSLLGFCLFWIYAKGNVYVFKRILKDVEEVRIANLTGNEKVFLLQIGDS